MFSCVTDDERYSAFFEITTRYCPICGKFVRSGEPVHRCSKYALNRIDREAGLMESGIVEVTEPVRTFADKLEEAEIILGWV